MEGLTNITDAAKHSMAELLSGNQDVDCGAGAMLQQYREQKLLRYSTLMYGESAIAGWAEALSHYETYGKAASGAANILTLFAKESSWDRLSEVLRARELISNSAIPGLVRMSSAIQPEAVASATEALLALVDVQRNTRLPAADLARYASAIAKAGAIHSLARVAAGAVGEKAAWMAKLALVRLAAHAPALGPQVEAAQRQAAAALLAVAEGAPACGCAADSASPSGEQQAGATTATERGAAPAQGGTNGAANAMTPSAAEAAVPSVPVPLLTAPVASSSAACLLPPAAEVRAADSSALIAADQPAGSQPAAATAAPSGAVPPSSTAASAAGGAVKQCSVCGKRAGDPGVDKTRLCGGCRAVRYCSYQCQKADWRAHKKACQATVTAAKAAAAAAARAALDSGCDEPD